MCSGLIAHATAEPLCAKLKCIFILQQRLWAPQRWQRRCVQRSGLQQHQAAAAAAGAAAEPPQSRAWRLPRRSKVGGPLQRLWPRNRLLLALIHTEEGIVERDGRIDAEPTVAVAAAARVNPRPAFAAPPFAGAGSEMKAEDFLRPHLLKLKAYTPIEPFEILAHKLGREPKDIVSGAGGPGWEATLIVKSLH